MSATLQPQRLEGPFDEETRPSLCPAPGGQPHRDWPAPAHDAALLHVAIEHMAQGLLMMDVNERITVLNRKFLEIYGLPGSIIKPGATAYDIVEQSVLLGNYGDVTVEEAWAGASKRLAAKTAWRIKQRLRSGPVIDIAYSPMPGGGWVTTHLDVTVRQIAEDRIAHLAHYDSLTGLANRALLYDRLTADIEAGLSFAILLIDLDRFKHVNDTLGHAFGDELLRQVSARISSQAPPEALIARMGGDEFLLQIRVPRWSDSAHDIAHDPATRLIAALCRPFNLDGTPAQIGASVGIAFAPRDGRTHDTVIRCADLALYQAKAEGRGTVRAYGRHLLRASQGAEPNRMAFRPPSHRA